MKVTIINNINSFSALYHHLMTRYPLMIQFQSYIIKDQHSRPPMIEEKKNAK